MIARVPLRSTLTHRHDVVDALGWGLQALLHTSTVDGVEGPVRSLSAERVLGPEALAVFRPGVVVASLPGAASTLLERAAARRTTTTIGQHGAPWLWADGHQSSRTWVPSPSVTNPLRSVGALSWGASCLR